MAQRRRSKTGEQPRLDMTPMIDVVFQLLIFFVVSLKHEDILSALKVARPQGGPVEVRPVEAISITVRPGGFELNGAPVGLGTLQERLGRFATFSKSATVVIRCASDSPHAMLIQALDACSRHQMTNLSIFSLRPGAEG